eukprot:COSAG06_NODE_30718_length_533_cov_1.546083_1_plen_25_part_10
MKSVANLNDMNSERSYGRRKRVMLW